jgi:hypothetical protein
MKNSSSLMVAFKKQSRVQTPPKPSKRTTTTINANNINNKTQIPAPVISNEIPDFEALCEAVLQVTKKNIKLFVSFIHFNFYIFIFLFFYYLFVTYFIILFF